MLPSFSLQRAKIHGFRIFLKLKALENSGELIQLGAEGARPCLKLLRLNLSGKRTESIGTMPVFPSSLFLSIVF
jgi:hypothetical protein